MNKFETLQEMIKVLFEEGETIIRNDGVKFYISENFLMMEEPNGDISDTLMLPVYQDCKFYIERWHDGLKIDAEGSFDKEILCHVGDDIRLVTGYCEISDRYILIEQHESYSCDYANADDVKPVTFNDVSHYILK